MSVEPLVLASASPRRRRLLRRFPVPFAVMESGTTEPIFPGESPTQAARRLALRKARGGGGSPPERMGPRGGHGGCAGRHHPGEASRSVRRASHAPLAARHISPGHHGSGPAASANRQEGHPASRDEGHFSDFRDSELEAHLVKGRSLDKAGGYAIQDQTRPLVKGIDGCYYNVVRLPLCELTVLFVDLRSAQPPSRPLPPARSTAMPSAPLSSDRRQRQAATLRKWLRGSEHSGCSASGSVGREIGFQRVELIDQLFHVMLKEISNREQSDKLPVFLDNGQVANVTRYHELKGFSRIRFW